MDSLQLLSSAEKLGTPLYIYDAQIIQNQYKSLKNAFNGKDVKLHFALKALNNINILRLLKAEKQGRTRYGDVCNTIGVVVSQR